MTAPARDSVSAGTDRAGFGAALTIACTLTIAVVLGLMAIQLLVIHPGITGYGGRTGLFNQQRQGVKTELYLVGFVVILPAALLIASRLTSTILAGPNARALTIYAAVLAGSLAGFVILVKLSGSLPWGSGVKGVLVGVGAWSVVAVVVTRKVLSGTGSAALARLEGHSRILLAGAGVLAFGVLLCLTSSSSFSAVPLIAGTAVALAVLYGYERVRLPALGKRGRVLDVVVVALLLLAIPDLVVFQVSRGLPTYLLGPGLVQFQQDWMLGPANQLLAGGAVLVNVPVTQYGVGFQYFLAAWFRLAPIGYGTFGFLDGLLTALFYIGGYAVLRLAGVRRLVAASAIALGVLVLVYNFRYFVGQLPEEGPLRFGMPMLMVLAALAGTRWPRRSTLARCAALLVLAAAAIWALEAFAYTAVTYVAAVGAEAWLAPPGMRRRRFVTGVGWGAAAVIAAHVVFALVTLAATGQLPHWGQYLDYLHAFLLGGRAGQLTYGFDNWSPGLAVYAGAAISAAGVVLLAHYHSALARSRPIIFVALAATTAYSIALLSYADNRSSTYLFLYVSLPLLLVAALWLGLIFSDEDRVPRPVRRGALTSALAVAVLLLSAAWPSIGAHFSRTALARAYPDGGLSGSLHRLWHPPPIDPRAPAGIRLLDRYMPAERSLILFPTAPDLAVEMLLRSGRANLLPIGDPEADSYVPSAWLPQMRTAVARIRAGQLTLVDQPALQVVSQLHGSNVDIANRPIDGGAAEIEWILHALDERFRFVPIQRGPDGMLVARLVSR
jgi:hypothetical protein